TLIFLCKHPANTEIYTLSLHDALPIWFRRDGRARIADDSDVTLRVWFLRAISVGGTGPWGRRPRRVGRPIEPAPFPPPGYREPVRQPKQGVCRSTGPCSASSSLASCCPGRSTLPCPGTPPSWWRWRRRRPTR